MADLTTLLSKFLGSLAMFSGSASGVLTTSTTAASTIADTNETDLWTYSLPANTLNVDGRALRIRVFGLTANNANSKTYRVYFGSTVVSTRSTATASASWSSEVTLFRTGASAQMAIGEGRVAAGTLQFDFGTPAETSTGAITIKVTGQNAVGTANDITFKGAVVELLN